MASLEKQINQPKAQEKQTQNIVSEQINIPKSNALWKYPNFETFSKTLNTLDTKIKEKLLFILESIPEDELTMYLDMDGDNSNLITEDDIKKFIQEKNNYSPKITQWNHSENTEKSFNEMTAKKETEKGEIENMSIANNNISFLEKNLQNLKQNTSGNSRILELLSTLEGEFEEKNLLDRGGKVLNHFKQTEIISKKIEKTLSDIFKNKEESILFFQKLEKENPEIYAKTYSAIVWISPNIWDKFKEWWIPPVPRISKEILSQIPGATRQNIEINNDKISYNGKTIDLKTGKAYISWEKWYAIETSMQVPNSLELRVKYQTERLEILEDIQTNEKLKKIVEHKINLKENLEKLKTQISWIIWEDRLIFSQITLIEKELKKIDEKLKSAVPGYNPEQDENLKTFLSTKIKEAEINLITIKEKFDTDMQELLWKWKDEIIARDNKKRETITFLDNLWITNINQNDLQKIINNININPLAFGFSKKIDLRNLFEWTESEKNKIKKELFNLFSKIYEKMWIPIKWPDYESNYRIVKEKHGNDTENFNQKFKDLLYLWWGFKFNEFYTLVKSKEETKK